ncbi:MAG: flavin reductase family protein [Gemmatimonadetes bacterium]|nr:flavin reductase family protein [Gemmatimonadota bacterium]
MGKADIESDVFRRVMGHFPTGVTVVAARDVDGEPYGLTVNSFASVSLDPPLVLVCIDRRANSHDRLVETGTFTVSVLAANQAHIAARFASTPSRERFKDLPWGISAAGDPVVEDAAAWLECSLRESHEAGDHTILVGRVESVGQRDAEALVFHRGRYRTFAP